MCGGVRVAGRCKCECNDVHHRNYCNELIKGNGIGKGSQCSIDTPLRELTCHMGSHSVTCHPAEVTFPHLLPTKARTRFSDPERCKAELTHGHQSIGSKQFKLRRPTITKIQDVVNYGIFASLIRVKLLLNCYTVEVPQT